MNPAHHTFTHGYLYPNIQPMHYTYKGADAPAYLYPIRISMQKPIGVGQVSYPVI